MELKLKATSVFKRNWDAYSNGTRFIINQGGTRSSKTYSLSQLIIGVCLKEPGTIVSVVRRTMPALRASVMKDIIVLLKQIGIYNQNAHHKTEHTYNFDNGSQIVFFSADNDLKLRGRQHDIVWINEANELNRDLFDELNQRTRRCIFLDFNPSDLYCYIYDLYQRNNHCLIKSTYKDNPFLPNELVREIENYKNTDFDKWLVMGLGEISYGKEQIFTNIEYFDEVPEGCRTIIGADWGYNDPTTIIEVNYIDTSEGRKVYVKELLYESYLKPTEIVNRFKKLIADKNIEIMCDHRPEYVDMLLDEGFNIKPANKNIKEGIAFMKDCRIYIHSKSENAIKEFRNYKWKKAQDRILDVPVDHMNHAIDAARYAMMELNKPKGVSDWSMLF